MLCLRTAAPADLDQLYALDRSCFRPGINWSRREFAAILCSRYCLSVVAESAEGLPVGLWSVERSHGTAHILTVEVAPEERGRGIGSLLMAHLEQTARLLGLRQIQLEVAEDDAPAQRFYLRRGYVEIGRTPRFYLNRIAAIRMSKQF